MIHDLLHRFIRRLTDARRPPDFIIGGEDNPYMLRWYVIPRNRFFNIYYHIFLRSDDDRALHDHPWFNLSIILEGNYWEHTAKGKKLRMEGGVVVRGPWKPHRIELLKDVQFLERVRNDIYEAKIVETPARTLFITGPKLREWGFHCPTGWRHWAEFVSVRDKGNAVGRGCE